MAWQRARGDVRRAVVGEPCELVELGAVVRDEQVQGLVVARVLGPPDRDLELGAERARRDGEAVGGAGHPLGAQPRRRRVARQLDAPTSRRTRPARAAGWPDRSTARARRRPAARRARTRSDRARGAGIRSVQPSPSRAKGSAATGKPRSVASSHAGERLVGVGEAQDDRVPLHERARGGDRRRHRRQASGPRAPSEARTPECRDALHAHRAARRRPHRRARLRRPAPAHRPDLRPARRARGRPDQAHRARGGRRRRRRHRRGPALARPPLRQPRPERSRLPAPRRAHADHDGGRRAPGRQRGRPRAMGDGRARAPGRRRGHGHRGARAARSRGQRARHRAGDRLRARRRRRPDALRQRRQRLGRRRARRSPSARARSSSRSSSAAASACRSRFDGAYLTLSADAAAQAAEVLGARAVVPVHFEGWAHFTQGADELRAAFAAAGIADRLVVPEPGESVSV